MVILLDTVFYSFILGKVMDLCCAWVNILQLAAAVTHGGTLFLRQCRRIGLVTVSVSQWTLFTSGGKRLGRCGSDEWCSPEECHDSYFYLFTLLLMICQFLNWNKNQCFTQDFSWWCKVCTDNALSLVNIEGCCGKTAYQLMLWTKD